MIRPQLVYRKDVFCSGLRCAGYEVHNLNPFDPTPDDVLLIWNRYGQFDEQAKWFEKKGATVLVAENGYLREGLDGRWFALAKGHHAGAGAWRAGGPERWDALGIKLAPWSQKGKEVLILAQRGIGEPGVASPKNWAQTIQQKYGGRIRPHPGDAPPKVSLRDDLRDVACVITWHSAAALYALMYGVPVFHAFPQWIGARAALRLDQYPRALRDDAARLEMFRELIWAQWSLEEIANGTAFRHLLRL